MKVLLPFLFLALMSLRAPCAEVSRSFFDIQLTHPKENWYAVATTNKQHGTAELMLMKEGKGKVAHVSLEKKAPEVTAFDASELKKMQE
ncbi:MAG TPA: hypothetical protein VNT99_17675, partial [Methylomirabilota bacterium]|nr:hypothetical protein [Methylomirabilota bacterium]